MTPQRASAGIAADVDVNSSALAFARVLAEAPASPGSPRKKTIAAGPKTAAPRPRKAKTEPSRLDTMQTLIVSSLEDDKAENVVTLDLTGKAMFCDRMIIASGLADRQITAMA